MSKFVTYGATETLDNDQKFIIDSDRTGPGSITAKDAASSFLSKWSGFETFEEAVQNTISNNQEFIDRDTAIREETAELKKKIVTTFPAKEASGAVTTFESEFEDAPLKSCIVRVNPVQDLHGYDSPWPAGGGVNTLDPESLIEQYPSPAYGLAIARSGEWVTINGAYSGDSQTPQFRIMKKKDDSTFDDTYWAFPDLNSSNNIPGWISKADSNKTLTIGLRNMTQGTTYNIRFRIMGVTDTTRPTDYAPYSNECPITGWTGCEVQRTGKNLARTGLLSNVTWAASNNDLLEVLNKLNAGTYTFSFTLIVDTVMKSGAWQYGVFFGRPTRNVLKWDHASTDPVVGYTASFFMTFTISKEEIGKFKSCYLYGCGSNAQGIMGTATLSGIQLECDTTPTPYEPYQGETYPITFPTEAGTIYGGYVDVTGGELVVDMVEVADLGTLSWSYGPTSNPPRFFASLPYSGKNDPWWVNDVMLSTGEYTLGANVGQDGVDKKYGISTKIIYFTNAEYTNVDDFKASITGTQVVYRIATPIHYPLTPTEIKTLLGQNNIWADTGDISVEYLMSDVSWYVEKKLRAFQSILAGVEDSETSSKNYSTNTYLIFNDDIYRVTKTITAGETIEEGVNVTKTTVAEQLMALAQA